MGKAAKYDRSEWAAPAKGAGADRHRGGHAMRKLAARLLGWNGKERRGYPRFPGNTARTTARVRIGDGEHALRDFSLSGFCAERYDGPLVEGESFAFTFILPDCSEVPYIGTVSRIEGRTLAACYIRPVPELRARIEAQMPTAA